MNTTTSDSLIDQEHYRIRKFNDGWWSITKYIYNGEWAQFRGPFQTESEAELDCANAIARFYVE